jgi:hypothetical protein
MKNQMTKGLFIFLLILAAASGQEIWGGANVSADITEFQDFLTRFKEAAEGGEIDRYLEFFPQEIREQEQAYYESMFQDLGMDSLRLFFPANWTREGNATIAFVQAVFENRYSALIQNWRVQCEHREEGWTVVVKDVYSQLSNLYKMSMSGERVERVKSFRVRHMDIDILFEDALVFYDNLPDLETGMIVLGRGRVSFVPSLEREKHMLELVFKKGRLEDDLNYVFLRFSNSFFEKNIQIVRDASLSQTITDAERNLADTVFSRHYARSFTLNNSLTGGFLTLVPSGEEAVLEFNGKSVGTLSYIYSPYADEEVNLYQWRKDRILNLYSPALNSEGKRLFVTFAEMFDIQDYEIDIDFNPKNSYLSGRALIRFESQSGTLQQIKLKLNSDLEVLRIYDQEKNSLFYTFDRFRDLLYIHLLQPVPRGELSSIEVYYRGELPPPQQTTDVLIGPQARDVNSVTFITPPRMDTYLYSRAATWYPLTTDEDYFHSRLKVIVPPKYQVVSNGVLIETSSLDEVDGVQDLEKIGRAVYVFKTGTPVKYLSFIVGQFDRPKGIENDVPIMYYRTSEILPQGLDYGKEASRILDFYQEKFGRFPFDKLEIVHRQWTHTGGHSPASFIVLNALPRYPGVDPLIEKNSPVNLNRFREYYIAHEIAHQWWGQAVAWKTYHDQWISEGLSQYAAVLYLREKYGEGALNYILKRFSRWTRKKTKWGPITLGSRISFFDFDAYQSIIYNKTSLVLNMLRDIMGDDLFFGGLKRFYQQFRYSAAHTQGFFRVMQDVSRLDLQPFFDKWFNSYLLPDVIIGHATEKKDDSYLLKITVTQGGDPFVFPLWFRWEAAGQNFVKKVIVTDKVQRFVLETPGKPRKLNFNPNEAVPGRIR